MPVAHPSRRIFWTGSSTLPRLHHPPYVCAEAMPKSKKKKFKPTPYRDYPSSYVKVPQPKGEFVDLFKVMQERTAVRRAAAEAARSHSKHKPPSNRPVDNAAQAPAETNPMPKNKKHKPIRYRDLTRSYDEIPQPKGKFVNPFQAMRDRQAAEREAEAVRSRQQAQTSE